MSKDRRNERPAQDRDARLGAALRANLARRKAQARGRAADGNGAPGLSADHDKPQDGCETPGPAPSEEASKN